MDGTCKSSVTVPGLSFWVVPECPTPLIAVKACEAVMSGRPHAVCGLARFTLDFQEIREVFRMIDAMIRSCAAVIAASMLMLAPAAAHSDKVTVHRGAETHTVAVDAQGNAIAPQIRVVRVGQSAAAARSETAVGAAGRTVTSAQGVTGGTLWLIDPADDRLTACQMRKTFRVGEWVIDCHAVDLSRATRIPLVRR